MSTVNKETADAVIAYNGVYPGDRPVIKIIRYVAQSGQPMYGMIYEGHDPDTYAPSVYVNSPTIYWQKS